MQSPEQTGTESRVVAGRTDGHRHDVPDAGRRVVLEGCVNFRDLGGLPAAGGRTTRHGRLFRSGALHRLTARDLAVLRD